MRQLVVAIRETVPFHISATIERVEVEAGKKVELKLRCQRLWPDFKSPVTVTSLAFPGSIKTGTLTIPADKTEATATIEVQPNAKPAVRAGAANPGPGAVHQDSQGREQAE